MFLFSKINKKSALTIAGVVVILIAVFVLLKFTNLEQIIPLRSVNPADFVVAGQNIQSSHQDSNDADFVKYDSGESVSKLYDLFITQLEKSGFEVVVKDARASVDVPNQKDYQEARITAQNYRQLVVIYLNQAESENRTMVEVALFERNN